jgi:hypothetical protein
MRQWQSPNDKLSDDDCLEKGMSYRTTGRILILLGLILVYGAYRSLMPWAELTTIKRRPNDRGALADSSIDALPGLAAALIGWRFWRKGKWLDGRGK